MDRALPRLVLGGALHRPGRLPGARALADPHPPVLVGGGGEQLTLRVVAEHVDRWNVPMADPETYEHKLDVLAGHCESVGRDYDEIEKTVLARALVRDTTDGAHEVYEQHVPRAGPDTRGEYRGLVGTPADAASVVERFRDLGAEMVMIAVPRNDAETIERLAEDVLPEFA